MAKKAVHRVKPYTDDESNYYRGTTAQRAHVADIVRLALKSRGLLVEDTKNGLREPLFEVHFPRGKRDYGVIEVVVSRAG